MAAEEESPEPPLSHERESPEPPLSPWLRLMLAEIMRKREEVEQARVEQSRRVTEAHDTLSNSSSPCRGA
jgi:hypothetical protein